MGRYIQREPPIIKDDLRETMRETIEYLEYLRETLNHILSIYGKRMPGPEATGNQATIDQNRTPGE